MTFPSQATFGPTSHQGAGVRGAADEVLRRMLETMVQEALEREFERFLGAGPWERTPSRRGWRNGRKRRTLKTRLGTLELRVPKDREGRFQPSLFERYQRSEKALVLALVEMYLQGVSTRKVSKVVEMLCGFTISASQVSALTKKLDAELEAWRSRSLAGTRYPYLVVDAHVEKVRREGRVRSTAVLWVVGISEAGYREHLGVWLGASESLESWSRVFSDLVQRGLEGVATWSRRHGLLQLGATFEAEHQRWHYRTRSQTSSKALEAELKSALKDVWAAPSSRAKASGSPRRSLHERHPRLPTGWRDSRRDAQLLACPIQHIGAWPRPAGSNTIIRRSVDGPGSWDHWQAVCSTATALLRRASSGSSGIPEHTAPSP